MSDRPNLLFIMPDQLRHDFLSCYGAEFIQTPHIDRIANEGVRFDCAYSQHPLCVPARVSLLTGMNAIATGVGDNGNYLRPDHEACGVSTWAQMLSAGGYYTSAIGKMHSYPWDLDLGFQHRVGAEDKRWLHIEDEYFHFLQQQGHRKYHGNEHEGYLENRGAIVSLLPWECYWDHFVGREATEFLQAYDREEPFALMVGFPGPHCPYDPTAEYLSQFDENAMAGRDSGNRGGTSRSAAEQHRYEQTAVERRRLHRVYRCPQEKDSRPLRCTRQNRSTTTSARCCRHWKRGTCSTTPSSSSLPITATVWGITTSLGKGTFFEASTHVPLMARAPGATAGQVRDDLVTLTDVTATLLSLGGCDVPAYMEEDSRPLPGVCQESGSGPREILFGALDGGWMAFDGRMKLAKYAGGEQMLFDLVADPREQNNLMGDGAHGDICRRLDRALTGWVMASLQRSHADKLVYTRDLSADLEFASPGWKRTYPNRITSS